MNKNNINILDCTLRDGGYYNYWNFHPELVQKYLKSIEKSNIKFVELGFRFLHNKNFFGPFATTTDSFLKKLKLPQNITYAVMINAKDFFSDPTLINKKFSKSIFSRIKLVRIAVNFNDYAKCQSMCKILKTKGYQIGLNLMQSQDKKSKDYTKVGNEIRKWKLVDILYFADSLGCMNSENIENITKKLLNSWKGSLGIHAHNNKSIALSNTLKSIENGVTWCDSTITGMGRGAGNVETEHLSIEVNQRNYAKVEPKFLSSTAEDFNVLKKKYNWGANIYYHYAALKRIHPTYVQNILSDKRYNKSNLIDSLDSLSKLKSSSYSSELATEIFYDGKKIEKGSWNAKDKFKNKEVVLIGAGPSVAKYKYEITHYLKQNKKIALFLNINPFLNNSIAHATIACNDSRVAIDSKEYKKIDHKIILPKKKLKNLINLKYKKIKNYEINIKGDGFEIFNNHCIVKWPLAIAYALSILTVANVKNIKLIGFDGYKNDKEKNLEMNDVFEKYKKLKNSKNIISLTSTIYKIPKRILFK